MNINVGPDSPKPALDLDELMEKIRAEVAERKQHARIPPPCEPTPAAATAFGTRKWSARELLALPPTDFVRATHLAFFGREPSPDEFVRLRDRLLVDHVGRMRVLREFHRSREAHLRRASIEGLYRAFVWDRIYWSPPAKFGRFVGRSARNIWLLRRHIREFVSRVERLERRTAETAATVRNVQSAQMTDRQNTAKNVRQLHESIERNRKSAVDCIEDMGRRLGTVTKGLADTDVRLGEAENRLVDHWRGIIEHKRGLEEIALTLRSDLASSSGDRSVAQLVADQASHQLDPLYVSFEDRYRGTRADIMQRQRVYVPMVEAAYVVTGEAPVIDVGCGRGEWLELLSRARIAARGFDLNRVAIEECRERGLQVEMADGLGGLAALRPNSCSVVTAFHIIEHLPFDSVVRLLDESLRVLRPGGLLIVETPNPANLLVAAERFYLDPTHRNPLPSELTAYLLQSRGYEHVEVLPLHPVNIERVDYSDPMLTLLQERLYGPQDYGAIGRKSA